MASMMRLRDNGAWMPELSAGDVGRSISFSADSEPETVRAQESAPTQRAGFAFEPGARVAWDDAERCPRILSRSTDGNWFAVDAEGLEGFLCEMGAVPAGLRVVAPAPRPGQRWIGNWAMAILRDGVAPASKGLWLMERGFRFDGYVTDAAPVAPATTPPSPPAPTLASPSPDPVPWTRAHARRAFAAAMRAVEREPFGAAVAHVIGHLAEHEDLTEQQIAGVVAGLRAWEAKRSEVAPGRRRLTEAQHAACGEAAVEVSMRVGGYVPPDELKLGSLYEERRAAC